MTVFRHRRVWLLNGDNNVSPDQLIVLVGLPARRLLIVEFAREKQLQDG